MPTDYIGPTASLLESNTRATTASQDRNAQRGMKTQELLQSSSNAAQTEQGAMDRTLVQSKQAELLENLKNHASLALENLQQQEASKRQEKLLKQQAEQHHQENYFTMTPNTVNGIKSTIGMDFKDLEGKEVNKDVILALIGAKYKTDIANATLQAKKDNGKGEKDLQKELDKIEQNIKGNRDKLFSMSIKDLPEEVWQGGKPGDMRTLIQNISGNRLGKLSPAAQSQVQLVSGYINTMKSQQERANKIHEQLGTSQADYTGMGLGTDTGGDQKIYKSIADVQAAFKAGQLDRASAKKILQEQFGAK